MRALATRPLFLTLASIAFWLLAAGGILSACGDDSGNSTTPEDVSIL